MQLEVSVDDAALKALSTAINSLPVKLGDKAIISGMRRAMRPALRAAKRTTAPSDTGYLRKNIHIAKGKYIKMRGGYTNNPYVVLRVRNRNSGGQDAGKYLHLVLLGTKAGIRKTKKSYFVISNAGGTTAVKEINHKGTKANDFFNKAWRQTKNTCYNNFLPEIVQRINEVKAKAGLR